LPHPHAGAVRVLVSDVGEQRFGRGVRLRLERVLRWFEDAGRRIIAHAPGTRTGWHRRGYRSGWGWGVILLAGEQSAHQADRTKRGQSANAAPRVCSSHQLGITEPSLETHPVGMRAVERQLLARRVN